MMYMMSFLLIFKANSRSNLYLSSHARWSHEELIFGEELQESIQLTISSSKGTNPAILIKENDKRS